ncbi:carboxylesterase type B [Clohesyomyces aquaticus]|uniref:Carboxylic ester hydrolase n=1 Tax=Clohesyomyces aquaticus TaxID=1231657 RepID=A0A1Y1Z4N8_9PLEO|nr:carboxylesterase type B [Clohesyomyces aquaticus]
MMFSQLFVAAAAFLPATSAFPHSQPFEAVKRQAVGGQNGTSSLRVDLGYEIYEGVANTTTGLNTYKGIRFAAPPLSAFRWQGPQTPVLNRGSVISASSFASQCPQSPNGSPQKSPFVINDEDCLFLNVYTPSNASNLPVLVWIHGGGYGQGNGRQDLSAIINANDNGFVGVAIQYRLGAFGFLSSDEVFRNGVANAGILDQTFALQWVQSYIGLFGGNASQVTIAGLSAGGGSVMLQDIIYGGTLGSSLFVNSISASPYLPQQYGYKDWIPTQSYYSFATAAGCPPTWAYGNSSQTIFQCLVSKDSETLQRASFLTSSSGTYGAWGFLPVTDGVYIQELPTQALTSRRVNGINHLSGNNAEEGYPFTTQNITTENDLVAWIKLVFPLFTNNDIAKLLYYYPSQNITSFSANNALPEFATSGDMGLTALNVSQAGSGEQQRANNIYAETTFVCPSYWLAEAYNGRSKGRTGAGYKYQYSVPNAVHGIDSLAYFGPAMPNTGPDFVLAFQRIWGNFIRFNNPSVSSEIANGASNSNLTTQTGLEEWPPFTLYEPSMANLNETGGTPFTVTTQIGVNVTEYREPGLRNALELVNAYEWEGGRGRRCDFWKSVAGLVPE